MKTTIYKCDGPNCDGEVHTSENLFDRYGGWITLVVTEETQNGTETTETHYCRECKKCVYDFLGVR